jgi:hypothetical protein
MNQEPVVFSGEVVFFCPFTCPLGLAGGTHSPYSGGVLVRCGVGAAYFPVVRESNDRKMSPLRKDSRSVSEVSPENRRTEPAAGSTRAWRHEPGPWEVRLMISLPAILVLLVIGMGWRTIHARWMIEPWGHAE